MIANIIAEIGVAFAARKRIAGPVSSVQTLSPEANRSLVLGRYSVLAATEKASFEKFEDSLPLPLFTNAVDEITKSVLGRQLDWAGTVKPTVAIKMEH